MANKTMTVAEVFDNSRFTPYQYLVCGLCFLVTFLDGYDLTMIGVAVPKMADFLHAKMSAIGLALGIGAFGPLVGAVVLGTLADRFGRKWMLFISAIIFGLFTLLTAWITSTGQLAFYRFLVGIGLGGAVPNALTFGSEYAPTRIRSGVVALMYTGMPTGAMMGGLLAAYLIPHFGWQSLFIFGGFVPMVIALIVALALPESIEFLVQRGKGEARVRDIISRVAPAIGKDKNIEFLPSHKRLKGVPVKNLFTEGRALTTVLLWFICAGALYMMWILNSWAPTLLKKSGATVQQYSLGYAALNFGAVVSSVYVGRLMDKFNPFRVLQIGCVLAFLSLVAFGPVAVTGSFMAIVAMSIVCGLFINGTNTGTLTIATISYPSSIRASGIGWAYAVAKIGAMGAPAIGGFLISMKWSVPKICSTQAFLALVVAVLLLALHRHVATKAGQTAARAAVEGA
ncbi:MAG: MFS transporter [Syntrophorhabdales bacterium]|jgi:AAHS family 4-hydroxybenzoate transporter-like MFS transporter